MNTNIKMEALPILQDTTAPQPSYTNEDNVIILAGFPVVLTLEQAASLLQIPVTTARQMCREKRLPAFKVGQTWRIPRTWLEEYIMGGGSHGE
jgi:excisionase family DNA binding protein